MNSISYQVLNLLFLWFLQPKFLGGCFLLFVFLNLSTKNSIFFFFWLLLKMYFSNFLKLVFLFTCQDNHNPFYYLLGRLLQFPFPFFNCIKYSDHLILHLVSSVFFVPFSYVFSHNHSKPFNFLQL